MRIRSVILSFAALALAGCNKAETPAEITPVPTAAHPPARTTPAPALAAVKSVSQAELDAVDKAAKPLRLVLIVKTRNNPFFDPMIKGAEAEAKALGASLEVQAPPQETDKEKQFALVQDVTARGADAILIAPADSKGIVPALKQAQEKGILVINIDNRVDRETAQAQGVTLGGYVGADNEAGGKMAGEALVAALGQGGKVALLEGIRGTDNAEARKRGFTQAASAGGLQLLQSDSAEWDTQKAYAKFQAMLAAHPDLAGLFCANDKMALGALKAIQEAGKKGKLTVVGYDNIPDVRPYLQSGEMHASIDQHPDLMGKYGVRMAVGILAGKLEKGREFLAPLELIKGTR